MTEQTLHGHLPIGRGLRGRCPRCGDGHLFKGFLSLRPKCEHCGLDYGFADSGDGPAVFVILIAGFVVVFAALITEVLYQPQYWVHDRRRRDVASATQRRFCRMGGLARNEPAFSGSLGADLAG